MVTESPSSHWSLLVGLLRPQRRIVLGLAVVLAGSSLLPLAGPQLLRAFIDGAAAGVELAHLILIALGFVALGVTAQAASVATVYVATRVAWRSTNALREQATAHALRLDLAFHGATPPGALVERVDGDATAITRFFTDFVLRVTGGAITLLGALVLVAREDWRIGVAFAVFVGLGLVVIVRMRSRAVPQTVAERAAYADVIGLVSEQLDGGEDLRSLGAREHALLLHERSSSRHLRATLAAERASVWIWSATNGFFVGGGVLMLLAGWGLHAQGTITVGTVFLLFHYTQVLRRPLELIAEQLQEVQRAAAGAARIGRLLAESADLRWEGSRHLPDGPLPVRFRGVSFAYTDRLADGSTEPGQIVLDGIDLDVPAGSVVGLVGTTGSGKTTLARLALRLADPTYGRVEVGGIDLRAVDHESFRRRVAIVTQDVQLLDGTVRDNLTLFGDDVEDDELTQVLGELGLGEWFAGLPSGLDTRLGPAVGMSSGEAQLLGLGRAFLLDPGLVVLDEASSRVDPSTAEVVEAALDRLLRGRTALVIAHRLRAVDRADTIVVLGGGRIIEHGPRAALAGDPRSRFHELLQLETMEVGA
jgi:ATP-binding cassette, subfamily B, bacterial